MQILAGVESPSSGSISAFYAGGYITGAVNTIYKLSYATETSSTLAATLAVSSYGPGQMASNVQTAAYCFAGLDSSNNGITTIQKIDTSDTRTTLSGTCTTRWDAASAQNFQTAGYRMGGITGFDSQTFHNTIFKFTFSSETEASTGTTFSSNVVSSRGMSYGQTAAYACGGTTSSSPGNSIRKVLFSNDTTSTLGATLSVSTYVAGTVSDKDTAGYYLGGQKSPFSDVIDKLTYSSESVSTIGATLAAGTRYGQGADRDDIAGYHMGGETSVNINTIQKLTYATEARTTLSATLGAAIVQGMSPFV